MYADLKKAYYQCLDTIYIIAHNGYFHYYCRFVYQPNNFLKKKDSKICQIKSKYSEKKLESIKCSCVKLIFIINFLIIFQKQYFAEELFSMVYEYTFPWNTNIYEYIIFFYRLHF